MSSSTASGWVTIARSDSLAEGEMVAVQTIACSIAVYRVQGCVYAADNVCTHGRALLTDGWLEDHIIECPLHAGRFDIRNGKGLGAPVECDLKSYPVQESNGEIQIDGLKVTQ